MTGQRIFLAGLALGPALTLLTIPASAAILPVALGLSGATSAYALLSTLRAVTTQQEITRFGTPLLRSAILRDPSLDLPDLPQMRRHVAKVIGGACQLSSNTAPPKREQTIARAMLHIIHTWKCPDIEALSRDEVVELFWLDRLLNAAPDEAGALAQHFLRPDVVLEIRDEVEAFARLRALHDRQRNLYSATRRLWKDQPNPPQPKALLLTLQALEAPDPDLWHRVVLHHEPADFDQRAAALWCVRQRSCDQATVAAYLAFIAADGSLQSAARRGDQVFLDAILDVIEAWNAGAYRRQELALDPTDSIAAEAPRFARTLDQLAEITGTLRWPEPRGLFAEYKGRTPKPRSAWCLRSGGIVIEPDQTDYIDLQPARAA